MKKRLSPAQYKSIDPPTSLAALRIRMGDYIEAEMESAYCTPAALEKFITAYLEHASTRQSIVFCSTCEHARAVLAELQKIEISAEIVIAQTGYPDRCEIFDKFSRREVNCLVSVSALSEGFDSPIADCIVLCRPTKSKALAIQMVGRGLRYHQEKTDCLVLDFAGILRNFGAVEDLGREAYSMWPAETTLVNDKFVAFDEPNTRADGSYQILCPECDKGINSTAWKCPHCGHQLRNPEENIELPSLESYVPLVLQDKAAVFQELLREAFRTSRHPESELVALWRTLSSRKTG